MSPSPEFMHLVAEVWLLATDETKEIWLLPGKELQSGPVTVELGVHATAEQLLWDFGVTRHDVVLLHGTSTRDEGPREVNTHVAVANCDGLVLDRWPDALPVTLELSKRMGRAIPHSPDAPPTPRKGDVLRHAVRHLKNQLRTNSEDAEKLGGHWPEALAPWDDELAMMYRRNTETELGVLSEEPPEPEQRTA